MMPTMTVFKPLLNLEAAGLKSTTLPHALEGKAS
jgi:hypothetical protein